MVAQKGENNKLYETISVPIMVFTQAKALDIRIRLRSPHRGLLNNTPT